MIASQNIFLWKTSVEIHYLANYFRIRDFAEFTESTVVSNN